MVVECANLMPQVFQRLIVTLCDINSAKAVTGICDQDSHSVFPDLTDVRLAFGIRGFDRFFA